MTTLTGIFLDTGKIGEIAKYHALGIIRGVTTNPTILVKDGVIGVGWPDLERHCKEIARLIDPLPVSVEVTTNDPEEMLEQAQALAGWAKNINVKIPIHGPEGGTDNLELVHALETESPYMLLVAEVAVRRRRAMTVGQSRLWGIEQLKAVRSEIPAVTHVDYSARIQTVRREANPLFYDILRAFYERTGCPVLINTSFNVRGEPLVCTPQDAYRCFMRTAMDALVLEQFVLTKTEQPPVPDDADWRKEFTLD